MIVDFLKRLWDAPLNRDPHFHLFGCLLVVLILGLLLVQLRGPRSRWVGLLGLGGLFWAVYSEWLPRVTFATSSFWHGDASIRVDAFQEHENPDPETRLSVRGSCAPPEHQALWNETMLLNVRLFGPPPGSYIGPYPTRLEAADLMRRQGEVPSIRGPRLLLKNGSSFPLLMTTRQWWEFTEFQGLTNLHFEMGRVRGVVYLSDESILTETDTQIQLRIWGAWANGGVWAYWDK